jgi:hypothetical protein
MEVFKDVDDDTWFKIRSFYYNKKAKVLKGAKISEVYLNEPSEVNTPSK